MGSKLLLAMYIYCVSVVLLVIFVFSMLCHEMLVLSFLNCMSILSGQPVMYLKFCNFFMIYCHLPIIFMLSLGLTAWNLIGKLPVLNKFPGLS